MAGVLCNNKNLSIKIFLAKIIDKYDAKELYTLDDLKADLEKKYLY